MCKLLVAIKDEAKENKKLNEVIDTQYEALKTQPDGAGAMIIYPDGTAEIKRSLKDYEGVFNFVKEKRDKAKLIAIHTRIATSGGVSDSGVHFFKDRGIAIAHNGWLQNHYVGSAYSIYGKSQVGFKANSLNLADNQKLLAPLVAERNGLTKILSNCEVCFWNSFDEEHTVICKRHESVANRLNKLAAKAEDILSDSVHTIGNDEAPEVSSGLVDTMVFLKSIKRPLTKDKIKQAIDDKSFTGIALMYDLKRKEAFIAVEDKEVAVIKDDGYLALFSYEPNLVKNEVLIDDYYGLPFARDEQDEIYPAEELKTLMDGIFKLDFLSNTYYENE